MKKTKKYIVDSDSPNEYEITVKKVDGNTVYQMHRSKSEVWTETSKGEFLYTAIDDGNGVTINDIELDYGQFNEYFILLKAIMKIDSNLAPKPKIKQIKKI